MPAEVGAAGVAASLVLVAVAVVLSRRERLGLEPSIAWAALRALAQLLAVGAALGLVLDEDAPLVLALGWVVLMVAVAAATVHQRAREVPGVLPLAAAALGGACAVGLGLLFALGVFPLEGRTLVPLAGMTIGNSMAAAVVVGRRVLGEVADKQAEVEARLALGQPWWEAARPYLRSALRTALAPQVEQTKVVGLIALPGAMTGLILAGVDPVDAVLVQAAVMYLILGSVSVSAVVVGRGVVRRLFTPDHRLRPVAPSAG